MFSQTCRFETFRKGALVLAFVNLFFLGSNVFSLTAVTPGVGDKPNHLCRLMGALGCSNTGNERCKSLFLGTPEHFRDCSGDCFHCPGTDNANESLCVYVEGKLCHEKFGGRTVLCGGPDKHRFEGSCTDPNVEPLEPPATCYCHNPVENPNSVCNQNMLKCWVNPYPNDPVKNGPYLP